MERPLNRIEPKMPAQSYKTYAIAAPSATHWRGATCAEYGCAAHLIGWVTRIDETTDLGQGQAHYIRRDSGRKFVEHRDEQGMTVFSFEAGQDCFAVSEQFPRYRHELLVGRPELFLVRGGDWRANTGMIRQHERPEDWVEDFAEHQDKLATRLQQG